MRVAVYLDGTVSMAGYLAGGNSNYTKFLEELESSLGAGWRKADVHFYKFGRTAREIDRTGFRAARAPSFYAERGLSEVTSVEAAIDCRPGPNVAVVVTDLFQQDGDVNAVVQRIKNQCFQKGVAVGVLGVPSEFDGTVYDARVPAYRYRSTPGQPKSYRPFYALMFGDEASLDRLVQSLQGQAFVDARNFVLVSDHVVRDYSVALAKAREAKFLNPRAASGPNQFNFDLRKGGSDASFRLDVKLTPRPGAPPLRADQLELVAFRRMAPPNAKGAASDSVATRDLTLENVQQVGDSIHATLHLSLTDPPGTYVYQAVLRTGGINGFTAPRWVRDFSSDNPMPTSGPNRTLNLERFITDLRRGASAIRQPLVAKWSLAVRKL